MEDTGLQRFLARATSVKKRYPYHLGQRGY
jgi:hypothetical protein